MTGSAAPTHAPGGDTPRVVVAFANHRDVVDALLRAGADPNGQSLSGDTPLFSAPSRGDPALAVAVAWLAAGASARSAQ